MNHMVFWWVAVTLFRGLLFFIEIYMWSLFGFVVATHDSVPRNNIRMEGVLILGIALVLRLTNDRITKWWRTA